MIATDTILVSVVSGLVSGLVYALLGIGLNILVGVIGIINFAHGDFMMLASYMTLFIVYAFGVSPFVTLIAVFPVFFVFGVVVYIGFVSRIPKILTDRGFQVVFFFGVSLLMESAATLAWTGETKALPVTWESNPVIMFGGGGAPMGWFVAGALSAVAAGMAFWLVFRTNFGRSMRAVAEDMEEAQLAGVNVGRVMALSMGLSIALASVAGVVSGLIFPGLFPAVGFTNSITAFSVSVLGGLGNPVGGLAGGLVYGLVQASVTTFVSSSVSSLTTLVMIVLVMLLRPRGILPPP